MAKFVPLDEAAKLLNVPAEDLVQKRANGDIHGYRDGSSWKFRMEEIERFADEHGYKIAGREIDELDLNDEGDSELIEQSSSSAPVLDGSGDDDDLLPSDESDLGLADVGSSILSGLELDANDSTNVGGESADDSELGLVSDEGAATPASSNIFGESGESDDLDLSLDLSSGTGELVVDGSDFGLGDGLDLSDDDLALGDDDDLVLSSSSSDVTLGSDTGINLTSPSDSGLSLLDEPLDLGSSVSSLELPEDDEIIAVDDGELQAEEDFLLEPSSESGSEDEDSGSQIIPLDESSFESSGGDVFGVEEPLLMEDTTGSAPADAMVDTGLAAAVVEPGLATGSLAATLPTLGAEAPYTAINVLSLFTIVGFLAISAILMTDLMMNMWSWSGTTPVTITLMDTILSTIGLD
jgi:excisionase family DNA binding protein